jgi:histidinol dehydrogenase
MIKIISTKEKSWKDKVSSILDRSREVPAEIDLKVKEIIHRVKTEGDKALFEYTKAFDGLDAKKESIVIEKDRIVSAASKIDPSLLDALTLAGHRIQNFHRHEIEKSWSFTDPCGVTLGQKIRPVKNAGIYVPGGKNAFPSSMLMNVIPAKIAGVSQIVVTTPTPRAEVSDALLAAAHIAGIEKIYRIGGAQAIAALAYGTETIPKVDKIVGPGNIFVSHAKKLLHSVVGIDSIAGPSEILVIADAGAKPHIIAMDLFSQAEHDSMACSILITPEEALAHEVVNQMEIEIKTLPRKDVIRQSLIDHGLCIVTKDLNEAIDIANTIAPEHLELMIENAQNHLEKIENAGAIFLGYDSVEALGDYIAGPNHTLPTSSSARFYSPLGVYDFIKRSSVIGFSRQALMQLGPKAVCIARAEELEAHARSVEYRLKR